MFALISLLVVLVGCANWLTIGLLQFDFVAGLFGSQSNIFSRIVYVIVGVCAIILTINIIKNKGKIGFNFKKLKPKTQPHLATAETSDDFAKNEPRTNYAENHAGQGSANRQHEKFSQSVTNEHMKESSKDNSKNNLQSLSKQLNDRHNFNKNLRDK